MRPFSDDRREALRDRARALTPQLPRRGKADGDPRAVVALMAEAGLLRICVPAAFGGESDIVEPLSIAVVREELAFVSGLADALLAVQGLAAFPLVLAGTDAVKQEWLPKIARGKAIPAFAVSEPEAGSDLSAIVSTAVRDGTDYVLEGQKVFISNAEIADFFVTLVRVDGAPTAFLVPAKSPGIETIPIQLLASHPVGTVRFRGVRVPDSARLGAEGEGLSLCLASLEVFRPTVGASACGLARRAFEEAKDRVVVRRQFGKTLAEQPTVQFTLAEMATQLDAARLLVYRAAWSKEAAMRAGSPVRGSRESSMAKLFATEAAQFIVDQALQLHGAAGLVKGGAMESLYREVRAMRIYEGTSEIQKLVIARELLPKKQS